jgi:DNA-binding NarL/FixJ family response regulator
MAGTLSISILGDDRSTTEALAIALRTRGLHANPVPGAFVPSSPAVLILAGRESRKRIRAKLETARVSFPQTRIIVLAGDRDNNLNQHVEECVGDSLPTVDSFETLVRTLERLRDDGSADPTRDKTDSIGGITARTTDINPELTIREKSVFQLIAAGFSNKEIANLLSISLCTVKNHVHNILVKLNIPRRSFILGRTYLPGILGSGPSFLPAATRRKTRTQRSGSSTSVIAKR